MARRVVDASLTVALVLPHDYSTQAEHWTETWQLQQDALDAPSLWQYEVESSLRKAAFAKVIKPPRLSIALGSVFSLPVQHVEE